MIISFRTSYSNILIKMVNDLAQFNSWVGKILWRMDRLPIAVFMGFPDGSDGEESACDVRDLDSISGLRRSPGGGHDNPLQYSCLENPCGQKSLACCSPRGSKESDRTERLTQPSTVNDLLRFLNFMIMLSSVWIAGCNVINLEVEKSVRRIFLVVLMKDSVTFELWGKCR